MTDLAPVDEPQSSAPQPAPPQDTLRFSTDGDQISDAAYALLREQTRPAGAANQAGLPAAVIFVLATIAVLIAVSQGADLRQLLIAAIAFAAANAVAALVWASRSASRH